MRIAYIDCFAGISGDMFLGALIDAGIDPAVLHNAAVQMNIGANLKIEKVDRSGITSTKVHVLESGQLAEAVPTKLGFPEQASNDHTHHHHPQTQHKHKLGHSHTHEHAADQAVLDSAQNLGHTHEHPHTHEHEHDHHHGRSLTAIRNLIHASSLEARVKTTAVRAFELLGASEAKIHNVPIDQIHFHEVGAVDAIIDIVACSAGIHALNADRWVCSPVNVGGGMVDCAHGRFPVPAPAAADLLRGMPTYSADIQKELVTPTGAALLKVLVEEKGMTFGQQPAMSVTQIGYGAGTRNPASFPNVLRLSIGESPASATQPYSSQVETVTVLETALDDLSPQLIAQVAEAALQSGALDVMLTPVIMKKGRPGTLITILCNPDHSAHLQDLLLRETSTLGIRIRQDQRSVLQREHVEVQTRYGLIRVKTGKRNDETLNANPEFEDCRSAAAAHHVPVKLVQQAAIAAFLNNKPEEKSLA